MKGLDGSPIPLAFLMLVLGPCYLWWPQVAGPALFCFMPLLMLSMATKAHSNSRRLDEFEQRLLSSSMPNKTSLHPTSAPSGARD